MENKPATSSLERWNRPYFWVLDGRGSDPRQEDNTYNANSAGHGFG
jgi:hypothetical protein